MPGRRTPGEGSVPRVSVVIPSRDRWPLLRVALRSVFDQTLRDIEVIVVDDGSRDETPDALERIDDERLIVVTHATSSGVARARNDGLTRARTAWIAFLDDDDLWAPDKLERQLAAVERRGAVLSSTCALRITPAGTVVERVIAPGEDGIERQLLSSNVIGGPSTVLARADAVREAGGFDERLSVLADWDLWLRLAARGPLVCLDEPLAAILDHGANMQRVDIAHVQQELAYMRERHADRMRELRGDLRSATLSAWMASILLHEGHRRQASLWYLDAARHSGAPSHVLRAAAALLGERHVARVGSARRTQELPATPPWVRAALSAS